MKRRSRHEFPKPAVETDHDILECSNAEAVTRGRHRLCLSIISGPYSTCKILLFDEFMRISNVSIHKYVYKAPPTV